MNTKRRIGIVALVGAGLVAVAPAQPAAANDRWCTNVRVNGQPLLGDGLCAFLQDIIDGPLADIKQS